jgi:ELWxxDGT repeat protein
VKDIRGGSVGSDIIGGFDYGGKFFFNADDGVHGYEAWESDGTDEGTTMIKDIAPGSTGSGAGGFIVLNGVCFFSAKTIETGYEWWKTDGTEAGTTMVKDLLPGPVGSNAGPAKVLNGIMIIIADDGEGTKLWRSDGTEAGTQVIPGQPDLDGGEGVLPLSGYIFNGEYYCFIAIGGQYDIGGEYDLYKTDGNTCTLVKPLNAIYRYNGIPYGEPLYLTESGGYLYFVADDGLWRSDGTSEGTVNVYSQESHIVDVNGTLLEPIGELYYWNGSSTVLLKDIYPGSTASNPHWYSEPWDGKLLFSATDDTHGLELWVTDGTADGTNFVYDFNPGIGNSFPLTMTNKDLDFGMLTADNPTYGRELWITDGTAAGTSVVDLLPGTGSGAASGGWKVGNYIYLRGDDGVHGSELWKMDIGDTSSVSDWQMYK